MDVVVIPDRTLEQRRAALAEANRIRKTRSRLKRAIGQDRTWRTLALALVGDTDALGLEAGDLDTMRVAELLRAAPKLGAVKVNRALSAARISPSKTVYGLTPRQRLELLAELELRRPPTIAPAAIEVADHHRNELTLAALRRELDTQEDYAA